MGSPFAGRPVLLLCSGALLDLLNLYRGCAYMDLAQPLPGIEEQEACIRQQSALQGKTRY